MYVIAGVSGHVGSVLANQLLAAKHPVKVIVRDAGKGAAWSRQGAEVAVGSLDDQTFLVHALRGAAAFFALLPPPAFTAPDFFAAQKQTADAIAGAVKTSGVPYVVLLSSLGAELAEGTGPIKGLYYLENALRAAGTRLTAIRASSFQENYTHAVGAARQAGIFPNFAASADYPVPQIATRDIGVLAAEEIVKPAKTEVIDLLGPAYSYRQIAEKLGAALGKTLKVIDIPAAEHIAALTRAGLPGPFAKVFAEMYAAGNAGKLAPHGDRVVHGKTTLDETIKL